MELTVEVKGDMRDLYTVDYMIGHIKTTNLIDYIEISDCVKMKCRIRDSMTRGECFCGFY